ncbi:MAG: TonB-dependent receptor domain-containing protein, partial [Fidelibacterota bacterium]
DIFYNIADIDPLANYNIQASLDGPIPLTGGKVTFYSTARYYSTDGWLYGEKRFVPQPYRIAVEDTLIPGEIDTVYSSAGDYTPVSMNYLKKFSAQTKLTFRISPSLKLNLIALGSKVDYRDYSHMWRFNPEGDVRKFERSYSVSSVLTHTLSPSTFYTLNISNFYKQFREFLYENPYDYRYVSPDSLYEGPNSLHNDGTNMHHFKRNTGTLVAKIDFVSQFTPVHQFKAGIEAKMHKLSLDEFYIQKKQDSSGAYVQPFEPDVLSTSTLSHDSYNRRPVEFSAYIQDKIEFQNMIINAGLRFDYFNSRAEVLADPQDPNIYQPFKIEHDSLSFEERERIWYSDATAKYQLSPRFGIAYPITDRGVIHFSYGHFLQIPPFQYLYVKPGYKVPQTSGIHGVYGNPDLKAQKTVMYELGLQQQFLKNVVMDVTGFYRDVRNWVATSPQIETAIPGVNYIKYINRDYANVRGITLSLNKRLSNFYSFNIQYTFQIAEGSNSDPNDEFIARKNNEEPRKQIIPLDWDQTHTLNGSVIIGTKSWGVSLIGRYGSGYPYSPLIGTTSRQGRNLSTGLRANSRRKPGNYTFDLQIYKNLYVAPLELSLFAKVFNLFDRKNEVDVFQDTGRAGYTLQMKNIAVDSGMNNTLKEFFNRPDFFGPPREIQMGIEINF